MKHLPKIGTLLGVTDERGDGTDSVEFGDIVIKNHEPLVYLGRDRNRADLLTVPSKDALDAMFLSRNGILKRRMHKDSFWQWFYVLIR